MLFIKVFKSRYPSTLLFGLLLLIGLWLKGYLGTHPSEITCSFFSIPLNNWGILWNSIALLLVFFQALLLTYFTNEADLFNQRTNLVLLLYLTVSSFIPDAQYLSAPLIANLFNILAFGQILKVYNQQKVFSLDFNAGFLVGVATLFYFPSVVYFATFLITLAIVRSITLKDTLIACVGLLVPFIYMYAFQFLFEFSWYSRLDRWVTPEDLNQGIPLMVGFIGIIVFALLGWMRSLGKVTMRQRNHYMITATALGLTLLCWLYNLEAWPYLQLLASIPLSILLVGMVSSFKKGWMQELIYICILATALSFQLIF